METKKFHTRIKESKLFSTRHTWSEATLIKIHNEDIDSFTLNELIYQEILAIDTETDGLDFRKHPLRMVQLCTKDKIVHIIRFPTLNSHNLITLLKTSRVIKVFHHAGFDLRFLYAYTGAIVKQPIECTKTLMKMLYPGSSSGIGYTVQKATGVKLPNIKVDYSKWCIPELTDKQIQYAAADVLELIPTLKNLKIQLNDTMWYKYQQVMKAISTIAEMDIDGFDDLWEYRQNSKIEALKKIEWRDHHVHAYRLMRYSRESRINNNEM